MSLKSSDYRTIFYLQLLVYDLYIFVHDLYVYRYMKPGCCPICVTYKYFIFIINITHCLYTSKRGTVTCCDMNGKEIWWFEDASFLRSPRGVVVDNHGFVFVAGEQSGNIVVISPDGNSAIKVYQISVRLRYLSLTCKTIYIRHR
jgi:hypothetical protein